VLLYVIVFYHFQLYFFGSSYEPRIFYLKQGMYYILRYVKFLIFFFLCIVHMFPYLCYMNFDMFYILRAVAPCSWIELLLLLINK